MVGALPPETLKVLGFTPPILPAQLRLGEQVAAMIAADTSGVQRLLGQFAGMDRLAASFAVDTGRVQRLFGQMAGTDRLVAAVAADTSGVRRLLGQLAGTDHLAAAFAADTAGVHRLLGQLADTDRLAAKIADVSGIQRVLQQLARTDEMTAALGQTLLVQHRFAELAASAALGKVAADIAGVLESANAAHLAQIHGLSERMSQQMRWLASHQQLALSTPVLRVNRAWQAATTRVTVPKSILDFGRSAQAINLAAYTIEEEETPSGEIWYVARATDNPEGDQIDQLLGWLEGVNRKLPIKYKGAWSAIGHRGPDWISQAANSGMELLDWTLRTLAPDKDVLAWRVGTGMYAAEVSESTGKPHRTLRCRYIAHTRGLPVRALDDLLKGIADASKILQKMKHADDETMAEALRSTLIALEYCLLIMWRGV